MHSNLPFKTMLCNIILVFKIVRKCVLQCKRIQIEATRLFFSLSLFKYHIYLGHLSASLTRQENTDNQQKMDILIDIRNLHLMEM